VRGDDPDTLPRCADARTSITWIRTVTTKFHCDLWARKSGHRGVAGFGCDNVLLGRRRIDDGQWRQVAGVFEGGDHGMMRLYVNGVPDADPTASLGPLIRRTAESQWAIGRGMHGGANVFGALLTTCGFTPVRCGPPRS
jgi:hypothetical protein